MGDLRGQGVVGDEAMEQRPHEVWRFLRREGELAQIKSLARELRSVVGGYRAPIGMLRLPRFASQARQGSARNWLHRGSKITPPQSHRDYRMKSDAWYHDTWIRYPYERC